MAQNTPFVIPPKGFGYPNSPMLGPVIGDLVKYREWDEHVVVDLSRLNPESVYYDKENPSIGIQHPTMAGRKNGTVFLPLRLIRFSSRKQAVIRVRSNEVEARLKREREEAERVQKMSDLYAKQVQAQSAPVIQRVRVTPTVQPVANPQTTTKRIRIVHVPGH